MTTSSPNKLDFLKSQLEDTYIDFTPSELEALRATTSVPEFDKLMTEIVKSYNKPK